MMRVGGRTGRIVSFSEVVSEYYLKGKLMKVRRDFPFDF